MYIIDAIFCLDLQLSSLIAPHVTITLPDSLVPSVSNLLLPCDSLGLLALGVESLQYQPKGLLHEWIHRQLVYLRSRSLSAKTWPNAQKESRSKGKTWYVFSLQREVRLPFSSLDLTFHGFLEGILNSFGLIWGNMEELLPWSRS